MKESDEDGDCSASVLSSELFSSLFISFPCLKDIIQGSAAMASKPRPACPACPACLFSQDQSTESEVVFDEHTDSSFVTIAFEALSESFSLFSGPLARSPGPTRQTPVS